MSAYALDIWDKCNRRYAFERDWSQLTTTTTEIAYFALDAALACPVESDPEEVAKSAALARITSLDLRNPCRLDTYSIVLHHGMLAGIVAKVVRERLSSVLAPIDPQAGWRSGLRADSNGNLHRIVLCSHAGDDRLRAEAHSWLSIGELAALKRPHTIHLVVVGQERDGRRYSPWMRGQLHPISGTLRFAKWKRPGGQGRTSSMYETMPASTWRDVWREQAPDIPTARWIQIMKQDNVLDPLITSRELRYEPDDARIRQAERDLLDAAILMKATGVGAPMRRSACDDWRGPCPMQPVCYAKTRVGPEAFPRLYRKRER